MNKLTLAYINTIRLKLETIASKSIDKGYLDKSIRLLKGLSYILYKFFMGIKNDFIENQIQCLAGHIVKSGFNENNEKKSIVIIDEINADYIGLMVQYVDALIQGGYHILYLYEQIEHPHVTNTHLMHALKDYENAQIKHIPTNVKGFSKSQWIYNEVCAFGAKKLLLHFGEWAIEHSIACAALPKECDRYRINCADHCFWAGVSCTDYTFEFRHYGANLTYYERGIEKDHIIYMPFYPVMQETPYEGLPHECSGKFVFFSGGALYKIVDDNSTYFNLCKLILDNCPNSVMVFAGADGDNAVLSRGIEQFGLQGRFIPIGYRKDIFEVFKHCDVYFDTYPIGGGLMCRYAAQCSRPILLYRNKDLEECVSQKKECSIVKYSETDFLQEAIKLYTDTKYREIKGTEIHTAIINKTEFDEALLSFIDRRNNVNNVKWDANFTPRELKTDDAIIYNNSKLAAFYFKLFKLLGFDSVLIMPGNVISLSIYGIKRQLNKLFKQLLYNGKKRRIEGSNPRANSRVF